MKDKGRVMRIVSFMGEQGNFEKALDIRMEVFVKGQDVPYELEVDGLDDEARHYVLFDDQEGAVATARIRFLDDQKTVKIERVAVLDKVQGKGYGKAIMLKILEDLKAADSVHEKAILEAQTHALKFYEKLGFAAYGDEFMDAGIPHKKMSQSLK